MNKDHFILLIEKLDKFIRKFYFNKFIKGVLYTTALLFAFFLIISLAEYKFYFAPAYRKLMFYSFVGLSFFSIIFFIIIPLFKINRLGKIISHQQAAEIIGKHFSNVEDKLLNILQLKTNVSLEQTALVNASISQKSLELRPVPFSSAINLNENRQYLKYVFPPLILFFSLLFLKPNIIKESTNRLIKNEIVFEKPMPFEFIFNKTLETVQFENFRLDIKIEGEEIPSIIYLYRKTKDNDFTKVAPQKLNNTNYSYIFSNLQEDITFYMSASGFNTKEYKIKVSQKPIITNFQIEIDYPKYLSKKKSILKNTGDISAPFGSSVKWVFETIATEKVNIQFSDASFDLKKENANKFKYAKILKNNESYSVRTINSETIKSDTNYFNILVTLDEYPHITVKEFPDSTNSNVFYYIGEISDDYGLTKLTFNYHIKEKEGETTALKSKNISFNKNTISDFTHFWNIKEFDLKPGDKISYYFQVWDNDGVNGSKSARTRWMTIKMPSLNEYENKSEKQINEIKKELFKSISKTKALQKKMKAFKNKLLNKKELSWDDKKQMEAMLSEQKKLQENIKKLNENFKKNIEQQSEFKKINPEIEKKQEQVKKLFDEVLDEEMKKLIEKYQEMLKEIDKEKALESTEEMEITDKELEKELDRMLEMLKKLEFDQKLQETQEKINELAEKQEELANENSKETEELEKNQEKLNDEFEEIKKDLEELGNLDDELDDKIDMSDLEEDSEEISEEMENALEKLSKSQKSKASKSQKSAAQKMKELSQQMMDMQMSMESESLEEDMQALRQLLENLISLSFEEEHLLDQFNKTTINTPKYVSLVQDQHKLIEDSKLVEDSLFALAKRVFQIESFITDKIFEINRNLDESIKYLEDRKVYKAVVNQQYVMTGYNDLALMLSEVLEQMQQQVAQSQPGNQSCEKPGGSNPKPGKIPSLKKMQQQLSDQISKMGEQMKNGEQGKSGKGKSQQSKELAKMAAKQQAIRNALQKIKEGEEQQSNGNLGDLQKIIEKMKQNESDLVNKNLTNELLERQKEILTKLLEAETAEKERDKKEERQAETAEDFNKETPPALKDYLIKRQESINLYKNLTPHLKPFYRSISEKYFKNSINK